MKADIYHLPPMVKNDDTPPNRVKEMRKRADMDQAELAEAVDVTVQQISRIETGNRQLTLPLGRRIAEHLGCSFADLLAPEDNPANSDPRLAELIRQYLSANPQGQAAITGVAESVSSYSAEPELEPFGRKRA